MLELRLDLPRIVWPDDDRQQWLPPYPFAGYSQTARDEFPELGDYSSYICYCFSFAWGMANVSGVNLCKAGSSLELYLTLPLIFVTVSTNAVIIGSVTTTLAQLNAYANGERVRRQAIRSYPGGQR